MKVRLFNTRSVSLEDIDGYSQGTRGELFIQLKSGDKPFLLPQYLERRKELIEWVIRKYDDVDLREREIALNELMANDQFGVTVDERADRLKGAEMVGTISMIVGLALLFWALIYPRPFEIIMILLLAMPLIAVYITWSYKGMVKLYDSIKSPYPSVIFFNCHYDQSRPETWRVAVQGKDKSTGKSTGYYLVLSPWGRYSEAKKVSVSSGLYEDVSRNDSVTVCLGEGRLGVGWYWLER
jgi:hypothetical protein